MFSSEPWSGLGISRVSNALVAFAMFLSIVHNGSSKASIRIKVFSDEPAARPFVSLKQTFCPVASELRILSCEASMLFKYVLKPRNATIIPIEASIENAIKIIADLRNREFLKLIT